MAKDEKHSKHAFLQLALLLKVSVQSHNPLLLGLFVFLDLVFYFLGHRRYLLLCQMWPWQRFLSLFYGWFFQFIDCFLAYRSFWISWSPTFSLWFISWVTRIPFRESLPEPGASVHPHPFFQEFQFWHWDLWFINYIFLLPGLWSWDETNEIFRSKLCMKIHLQPAFPKSSWKFRFGVHTLCPRLRKDGQKQTKSCLCSYSGELRTFTDRLEMAKTQWGAQCHLLYPRVAGDSVIILEAYTMLKYHLPSPSCFPFYSFQIYY